MKISPDQLEKNVYRLLHGMKHEDLMTFVTPSLNRFNVATIIFLLANVYFLAAVVFLMVLTIKAHHAGVGIGCLLGGAVVAYCLIPVHEYIHATAYRINGAMNVSFDISWKKFVFLTVADKFVASKKEFLVVALAPFTVITISFLVSSFFTGIYEKLFLHSMLWIHTIFCIGDFGLVSYLISGKREIITYDDKEKKISYFYSK